MSARGGAFPAIAATAAAMPSGTLHDMQPGEQQRARGTGFGVPALRRSGGPRRRSRDRAAAAVDSPERIRVVLRVPAASRGSTKDRTPAAGRGGERERLGGRHTPDRDRHAAARSHRDDGADDRGARRIDREPAHEGSIDLDPDEGDAAETIGRGVARPEIVDREADPGRAGGSGSRASAPRSRCPAARPTPIPAMAMRPRRVRRGNPSTVAEPDAGWGQGRARDGGIRSPHRSRASGHRAVPLRPSGETR